MEKFGLEGKEEELESVESRSDFLSENCKNRRLLIHGTSQYRPVYRFIQATIFGQGVNPRT